MEGHSTSVTVSDGQQEAIEPVTQPSMSKDSIAEEGNALQIPAFIAAREGAVEDTANLQLEPLIAPSPLPLPIPAAATSTPISSGVNPAAPLPPLSSSSPVIGPRHSVISTGTSHYQPSLSSPPKSAHHKTGLKKTYFSRTHFSSPFVPKEKGSEDMARLVVRILDGKELLASDVQTGKSDPICFAWCCLNQVG